MHAFAVVVMVAVELGAGFAGPAAVGIEGSATTIEVELSVGLASSPGPVLAHLLLPGRSPDVRPLVSLGGGRWGSTMELLRAEYQVVFEDVASGDLSAAVFLTEIGVEPELLVGPQSPPSEKSDDPAAPPPWGWLSLAAGTAGVALGLYLYAAGSLRPRHLQSRLRSRRSVSS